MKKRKAGIHFYININNLNSIIKKEEKNNDDLSKTFHALDTYTKTIERFANEYKDIEIEKFTTSRYHFYVPYQEDANTLNAVFDIMAFSGALASELNNIGKYKSISKFEIGIGADFGQYTEFEFSDPESEIEEMTTIGSPANRAAKLQSECGAGKVLISKALYDILPQEMQSWFSGNGILSNKLAIKYNDLTVYETMNIVKLTSNQYEKRKKRLLDNANECANSTNLSEIIFSESKSKVDFTPLSLKNSKWADEAIVLFSDIRGFTHKVDNGDLPEIKQLTQLVLSGMNKAIRKESGTHVQFQGDRESAIFNSYKDEPNNAILRAIFAAMRIIDMVEELNADRKEDKIRVGIGCSIGQIFATRIGIRGNKFNVIMGETVKEADIAEDCVAGATFQSNGTEIAITYKLYNALNQIDNKQSKELLKLFEKRNSGGQIYYICKDGYKAFKNRMDIISQDKNATRANNNNGIRPWGK